MTSMPLPTGSANAPAGGAPETRSEGGRLGDGRPTRSREVAWRIFAHELTSASLQERGEGEKATTHVLTPLGARVGRLLMVGSLGQIERVGEGPIPLWRSRLSDPTGGVSVTAGSYHPRAAAFLAQAKAPVRAVVVGKPHLFVGREGVPVVTVRAEVIAPVGPLEEQVWVVETARETLRRIALSVELASRSAEGAALDPARPVPGFPRRLVASAVAIRGRYPTPDPERFRAPVLTALRAVASSAAS